MNNKNEKCWVELSLEEADVIRRFAIFATNLEAEQGNDTSESIYKGISDKMDKAIKVALSNEAEESK